MSARLTPDRCYMPSRDAALYPNLTRVLHLKVKGRPTTATHDLGAYTYECRHFIDREYLSSIPGGADLLDSTVPSEPPCRRVEMASAAPAEVLGMLPQKLPCTLWTPAGHGARRKLCLDLAGVLVVESLPVPLHVSLKSLMESCGDDETLASDLCVAAQGDPVENRFGKAAFPERYRDHDFWRDADAVKNTPNLTREQVIRAESALMAARGRDGVSYASCARCGLRNAEADGVFLKRCAGCDVTHYCSRQCQHAHWGIHKVACVGSSRARAVDERGGSGDEPWRADGIRSLEGSVRSLGVNGVQGGHRGAGGHAGHPAEAVHRRGFHVQRGRWFADVRDVRVPAGRRRQKRLSEKSTKPATILPNFTCTNSNRRRRRCFPKSRKRRELYRAVHHGVLSSTAAALSPARSMTGSMNNKIYPRLEKNYVSRSGSL